MRHSRLRAAVAASVVAGVVQALPASAADHQLLISAAKSTSTKLEIRKTASINPGAITIRGGSERLIVSIRSLMPGRGSVDWFTVVRLHDLDSEAHMAGSPQLPPGTYEVAVVTERPVTVVLPTFERDGTRQVRPTRPLVVQSANSDKALSAGRSAETVQRRGAVAAGRYAVIAFAVSGQRAEQTYGCVTTISSCPERPPVAAPQPLPAVNPAINPVSTDDKAKIKMYAPVDEGRDALFGVDGVRTQAGSLKTVVITFS